MSWICRWRTAIAWCATTLFLVVVLVRLADNVAEANRLAKHVECTQRQERVTQQREELDRALGSRPTC